jgi:glycosyltransferase involved in cell wall biosynthesis
MKFSIITPSFNQGQFIKRTLLSVSEQKKYGFEVEHIVMDGGSTDNTIKVLKAFPKKIQWTSVADKGQTHALNKGILSSTGDIIGWLNSDDIYYPDTLRQVAKFFKKNKHISVVYGMADHINKQDVAFEAYPTRNWNFERLKDRCYICQPALFLRRSVILEHGLFDENLDYCMDYEYWLRLGKAKVKISHIRKKLAGSRLYAENKTMSAVLKVHIEVMNMLKAKFHKVPESWLAGYANAVAIHTKKLILKESPFRFIFYYISAYWYASLKWNKSISMSTLKLHFGHIKSITYLFFKLK